MANTVIAPLVLVTDDTGAVHYAYKGQDVPAFVQGDQLKRLTDGGFVGEVKTDEGEEKKPARKSTSSK